MATAPANDVAEPVVAGEIIILDPRQIAIGTRLRPIDDVWAYALGAAMARDGQITPIDVCRTANGGWELGGPGGHRLTGALVHEMDGIEARVVSSNEVSRRRREAAENVFRRDNSPIERAAAVAELVRLQKVRAGLDPAKDGRAASAQARWQKQVKDEAADTNATIALAYGWSEEIAGQIGLSRRSIENDLMLYRRLLPSLVEQLRTARHAILGNATQLRALAKLDAGEQARAVALLISDAADRPRTAGDAIARVRGSNRAVDPGAKRLSAFIGSWQRMSLAEKKGALTQLAGMLPAGQRLVGDTELTDREVLRTALGTAFDFFIKLDAWDPAVSIEMIADDARGARHTVQLALMSANTDARKLA